MSGPHDRLIRETFARPEAATWLLARTLPPLHPTQPPTPLPDTALLHGRERRADLAFDLSKHDLRVFIEHQSSHRSDMAWRCLEHLLIATRAASNGGSDDAPPRIHFLVLFQGPGRWTPATTLAPHIPQLPDGVASTCTAPAYDVCHLEDLPLDAAPPDARVAIRVLLRVANAPREASPWAITDDEIADLHQVHHQLGPSAVATVIGYLTSISATPPPEALMAQLQQTYPELAEDFVSYADQLRLKGEQIGAERTAAQYEARLKRERERMTRLHQARLKRERERAEREREQALLHRDRAARERADRERAEQAREHATNQQRDILIQLATKLLGPPSATQRATVATLSEEAVHAAMTRLLTATDWDTLLG